VAEFQAPPPAHPVLAGLEAAPIARTKQFYISHKSNIDGQLYEGQFTTKKLSVRDLARIGVRKTQLNGGFYYDANTPGQGIDPQTDYVNAMVAHMELALSQAPLWFNLDTIIDTELLGVVFTQVMEFENSFFRFNGEGLASSGGSQNASSQTGQGTGTAGSVTPVGGKQVSSALEP
jgi:hypothetical protein